MKKLRSNLSYWGQVSLELHLAAVVEQVKCKKMKDSRIVIEQSQNHISSKYNSYCMCVNIERNVWSHKCQVSLKIFGFTRASNKCCLLIKNKLREICEKMSVLERATQSKHWHS